MAIRPIKYSSYTPISDEEVWLRVYCASISRDTTDDAASYARYTADIGLKDFKNKFRVIPDDHS